MDFGWLDICLNTKDVKTSREFYESLGFTRVEGDDAEDWAVMVKGDARIGLYGQTHLKDDPIVLNFRGAPIPPIHDLVTSLNIPTIFNTKVNDDGTGTVFIKDPDGHTIMFDTASGETKKTT